LAPFIRGGLQVHLHYRPLISVSNPFSPWRGLPSGAPAPPGWRSNIDYTI
jgi:hypothetical protein